MPLIKLQQPLRLTAGQDSGVLYLLLAPKESSPEVGAFSLGCQETYRNFAMKLIFPF
jgi:hypothetical protein